MSKLTPEQIALTKHESGPGLVVATAGSGKTTCLMAFMLELQRRGVDPTRILCMTFTKAAAAQMRPRLAKRAGEEWAALADFRTIHSFAYQVLKLAGVPMKVVIEDPSPWLRPIMQELGMNIDATSVENMATDISRYKNLMRPPGFMPASTSPYFFNQVLLKYEEAKLVERAIDMDDLIERAVDYLRGTPTARRYWQDRYDWVLVDEHQDTSPIQWVLIRLIVPEYRPNLICVGDDDQAIYGWRGANPDALLDFHRHYPGAPVYPLSYNHRCPEAILTPAARLIAHNRNRFPKSIKAARAGGDPPRIVRPTDPREELSEVVRMLQEAKERGENLTDYAVLYRTAAQAVPLIKRLEEVGIAYYVLGGLKNPFGRWMCKDVMSYLKVAWSLGTAEDLERIVKRPRREGLAETSVRKQFPKLVREKGNPLAALEYLAATGDIWVRSEAANLVAKLKKLTTLTAGEAIPYILRNLDYERGIYEYCSFSGSDQEEALEQVYAIMLMAEPELPSSEILTVSDWPMRRPKPSGNYTGVALSTMHSAKGLEWKHVIIIGAVQRNHPLKSSNGVIDEEEERRLFYVAMTRAKERLTIMAPLRWTNSAESRPSPFLAEAGLMPVPADAASETPGRTSAPKPGTASCGTSWGRLRRFGS